MSSFGINLDLRLNGQTALDRAIRGAKSLENIVKRLKDKPLDLSNIGGAARLDEGRLGKARKDLIAFAAELKKSEKPLANTEAGLREFTAAFGQLAANTKAGTPAFENFVGVIAKAEKELEDIAHATENARRKALGLLSVEEEAAQLAQKAAQKKAKEDEAKARLKNERAIERENRRLERLNREKKREAELAKRNRGRAIGDLAASVGFPLLFGGGVGSVAGGALGSLVGSAAGIGFGGQILGSALGQGLDQAAKAANQFALAATKASTSLDALIQGFGLAGTSTAASLSFAETLGIGGAARTAAQGGLLGIVGESGVKSLENLATSAEDAGNALSRFGAATTATFAPILTNLNQAVAGLFGGISKVEELRRATDPANQPPIEPGGPGAAARQEFARARAKNISALSQDPEVKAQLELEEKINKVVRDRIGLAEQATALEKSRLTSRRDVFAVDQGNLAIQAQQNKLDVLAIQLAGELTAAKRRELELEQDLTKEAKRQAEAAKENARIEAQRQIQREQISGAVKQIGMLRQEQEMELKFKQMEQGRFKFFEKEALSLENKLNITEMTLDLEQKRDLIGVNEAERVASINRDYEIRRRLAKEQYSIELLSLEQANAAYRLSRLRVEQEIELQNLQAKISADQQIGQTSPFARETELMDPFFGASRQLEIDQVVAYNNQLSVMEKQLSDVSEQLTIFALDPNVRQGLEDQQRQIKNQIANFKEYQPAIDEAALAQARFTEAMAITVPVTDSLFDSLLAVVDGTKTAEQAFADFLRGIASMLMDAAKQMIATYIAIGIARMFAGVPGSSEKAINTDSLNQIESLSGVGANTDVSGLIPRANGGPVGAGRPYLVGERGPELFVPGAKGNIVPNNAMGGANVVVNVDASGSNVEGDSQQQKALGKAIGLAVQSEIAKQKRPGGLLS